MSTLALVIFFSLIGGIFSLVGGLVLLSNKRYAKTMAAYATPFAAGALLAAAFSDLLPEAGHSGDIEQGLLYALIGILGFFLLERFLHWFHHHHDDNHPHTDPDAPLIIIGDTLHNFIDGIAIAAGFLVGPETGIVVTLAVAAHEIPQEIGDFGLLLSKGMRRRSVILVNIMSALATTVAAVTFFLLGQNINLPLDAILGLVAGFFIYIATSDIIPSIHHQPSKKTARIQTLLLIIGVLVVASLNSVLHNYIDQANHGAEDDHQEAVEGSAHSDEAYEVADHDILPTVELAVEKDALSGWRIELITTNFTFTPEKSGQDAVLGEGHAHLYLNGEKVTRLYGPYYHLEELPEEAEIKVTLNTNDHREYMHDDMPVTASVEIHGDEVEAHSEADEDAH